MSAKSFKFDDATGKALLLRHRLHMGMYARVGRKLGIHASYVSRVASGERQSEKVLRALLSELANIGQRGQGAHGLKQRASAAGA